MKESLLAVRNAVVELKDDEITTLLRACIDDGVAPIDIIEQALGGGLDEVGAKFESGDYFLSELIIAGEIVTEATDILREKLNPGDMGRKGKVLLATVKGDIHDIGKKIVGMMLSASGFGIVDLGVDVPAEAIVEAIRANDIRMVGLSALLTTMAPSLKEVSDRLVTAGIRDSVKIAIGGACCSEHLAREMGADAFGESAVAAVGIFDGFRKSLGMNG